jgi:hypothetical protein
MDFWTFSGRLRTFLVGFGSLGPDPVPDLDHVPELDPIPDLDPVLKMDLISEMDPVPEVDSVADPGPRQKFVNFYKNLHISSCCLCSPNFHCQRFAFFLFITA